MFCNTGFDFVPPPPPPKRKRGVTNEDKYARTVIKNSRVKGECYKNYKGKFVPSKTIPEQIICHCPRKCHEKISVEAKHQIWNIFYSFDTKNNQDIYLQTLIEYKDVQRRAKKAKDQCDPNIAAPPTKTRSKVYVYNLKINGSFTPVCKNVFLQIHGVSKDRVERITSMLLQNKLPVDMRGKNRSGNAIESNILYLIHDHISRFEVKETSGSGKPKRYLDASLNVSKMYQMFQATYPDLKDKVKYSYYYKYFKENFNLTFGLPQSEVCSKCDPSKHKDPNTSSNPKPNVVNNIPSKLIYDCNLPTKPKDPNLGNIVKPNLISEQMVYGLEPRGFIQNY